MLYEAQRLQGQLGKVEVLAPDGERRPWRYGWRGPDMEQAMVQVVAADLRKVCQAVPPEKQNKTVREMLAGVSNRYCKKKVTINADQLQEILDRLPDDEPAEKQE